MTTGNILDDKLYTTMSTYNGAALTPGQVGRRFSKVWSGSDSLVRKNSPRAYTKHVYEHVYIDKKGRTRTRTETARIYEEAKPPKKTPNPYSLSYEELVAPLVGPDFRTVSFNTDGSKTVDGIWGNCSLLTPRSGSQLGPPAMIYGSNESISLIQKLREQFRGSDFNLGVTLGEGRETLRMIGDTTVKIARAYALARKGDIVSAARTLVNTRKAPPRALRKRTASNWLELQYGWMPLLHDIRSGAEQLAHRLNVPLKKRYAVRNRVSLFPEKGGNTFSDGGKTWQFARAYSIASRQIVAYVSEDEESIPQFAGLTDPELIAWELLPFSFVVDWVAPFGGWLEARAFASHLTGMFITTDLNRQHLSGFMRADWPVLNGGVISRAFEGDGGAYSYTKVLMNRSITASLSVPMPNVVPLSKAASWQHCVNGLALLTSITTKNRLRSPS